MKLTELLTNQRIVVQLIWGEQQIEFSSEVVDKEGTEVFVTPYLHDGSPLELNISASKGVVCNLFTDDPFTQQRISWRNVDIATVERNDEVLYSVTTSAFNINSAQDDRRQHDRVVVQAKAKVFDGLVIDGLEVLVHDISDIGISFYAPSSFETQSNQLTITFTDTIDDKPFNARVGCTIMRTTPKAGNILVGCKVTDKNKDYQFYGFLKRLKYKNKNKAKEVEESAKS